MRVSDPLFAYLNARIRAIKGQLIPRAQLEDFLRQNDLTRMSNALLNTVYHQEMAEALTRFKGADAIEEAVTRHLMAMAQIVLQRAEERPRELVALVLERWNLNAVKPLLRIRHQGIELGAAAHLLMPGADFPPSLQRRMAAAESMEALIGRLTAWNPRLCGGLAAALPEYKETGRLSVLEDALDRQYFVDSAARLRRSRDENEQLLHFFLQLEIDLINLRLAFVRLRQQRAEPIPPERFLPEGTLPEKTLAQLGAVDNAAVAAELLKRTRYRSFVEELYQFMQTRRFSPVERLFERVLMEELRKLAMLNPLSLAIAMDFAWRKYNEGINIRLIARGLAGHLPTGRVREELVFI